MRHVFYFTVLLSMFANWEIYSQDHKGSFVFEGRIRYYDVYLPQDFQANMPLVLNLHGYNVGRTNEASYTSMHEYADTSGFIIVYPEGSMGSRIGWNNGYGDHATIWTDSTSNDVGFISALIDTIDAKYDIDLNRVYSCGWSMGGIMTYRLAIELGHRFAAVSSVAGKLNSVIGNIGSPIRSFPLLHMHGTEDQVEFWEAGQGNSWSVKETLNFWLKNNGCELEPDTVDLPDLNSKDRSTVQKISYTNCSDENPLIFYKIEGGGHGWPGGDNKMYQSCCNPTNRDINASDIILKFFKNHENPLVNIAFAKSKEVYPIYLSSLGDSLRVNARLANPDDHPVTVKAYIEGSHSDFIDSLQLFDDGLKEDGGQSDKIFRGKKWLSGLEEDNYNVTLKTTDEESDLTTYLNIPSKFTTIGPLVVDNVSNGEFKSKLRSNLAFFDVVLKNLGQISPAKDVGAIIFPDTTYPCVEQIAVPYQAFGDIEPGETAQGEFRIYIKNNCIEDSIIFIPIDLEIESSGSVFWTGHFELVIDIEALAMEEISNNLPTKYSLGQNYPNPFNPTTAIGYQLSAVSDVELSIYDLVGQKVATLVSEKQQAGYHQVEWDASGFASGVYYYRIEAGEFVAVKKMVLLR